MGSNPDTKAAWLLGLAGAGVVGIGIAIYLVARRRKAVSLGRAPKYEHECWWCHNEANDQSLWGRFPKWDMKLCQTCSPMFRQLMKNGIEGAGIVRERLADNGILVGIPRTARQQQEQKPKPAAPPRIVQATVVSSSQGA